MTLATGSRLGPYEILAPLGAGGMGEVFRARDTRLGREVAVKVLPDHLRDDPEAQDTGGQACRRVVLQTIHDGAPDPVSSRLAEYPGASKPRK